MRRFRRFRFPLGRLARRVGLVLLAAYLLLRLLEMTVLEPLAAVAETEARLRGIDATNRVVLGSLGKNLHQDDLVSYVKDQSGRIAAYHVNTQAVNAIASEAAAAVSAEFRRMSSDQFGVPLGALLGTRVFAAEGPAIPVRLMPIGSVEITVEQDFKAEGINQTRHRIWLRASARVRVILPVVTREIEVTSDLPITETVIVGPVPSSFYGGKLDGVTIPGGP